MGLPYRKIKPRHDRQSLARAWIVIQQSPIMASPKNLLESFGNFIRSREEGHLGNQRWIDRMPLKHGAESDSFQFHLQGF